MKRRRAHFTLALTPTHIWSQRVGGTSGDSGYGAAVEGLGNVELRRRATT